MQHFTKESGPHCERDPVPDIKAISALFSKHFPLRKLVSVERIDGGLAKLTYKLNTDDKPCVLQVWEEPNTGLTSIDYEGAFEGSLENMIAAEPFLKSVGINTPEIFCADTDKDIVAHDCVFLEFVDGENLFQRSELCGDRNFNERLGHVLGKLNGLQRSNPGLVCLEQDSADYAAACCRATLGELNAGGKHNAFLESHSGRIRDALMDRFERIVPRSGYRLIYEDFKPEHVLITRDGSLYLLDSEGCKYGDFEFDLADYVMPFSFTNCDTFLNAYRSELTMPVDANRLSFYKLYRHVVALSFCSESLVKNIGDTALNKLIVEKCEKGLREEYLGY
jgi:Ser/Thr protein kinase RdoA (MazF antagonist)